MTSQRRGDAPPGPDQAQGRRQAQHPPRAQTLPRPAPPRLDARLGLRGVQLREGLELALRRTAALAQDAGWRARRAMERRLAETRRELQTEERRGTALFAKSFVVVVLLPTLAASLYFLVIASDQFVSEAKFAVRGATETLPGADAVAPPGMAARLSVNQDAFLIADYIRSPTIVAELSKEMDLRAIFDRPGADFLARFSRGASEEALLRRWREAVGVDVEILSGLVTLTVTTFLPQDSLRLAEAIRARADAMINGLLARMRADMTAHGEVEVRAALEELARRRAALEAFRNARMALDPLAGANALSRDVDKLRRDLIDVEVRLSSARANFEPDALQTRILESDRDILKSQIAEVESRIVARGGRATAADALVGYDRLEVERNIAEKRVETVEKILATARREADRRHVYLVSIQDPTTPRSALEPRRGFMVFSVFAASFLLWSVSAFSAAAVRDHAG
ncbi:hypothetical protein [Methylocella sp.]|uniref:hypothetical protein n=1 Tax=Methylocella sp. TaxID=1978226 RepID=UPI003784ACB5